MSRTALFGGTFDPPHNGHANVIKECLSKTPIDKIIIVPSFVTAFKEDIKSASFQDRFNMCALMIKDIREGGKVSVSSFEGEEKGVSYTSNTVKHFFPIYSFNGKLDLIIGDDILPSLSLWHDFEYLKEFVRFWCFKRKGFVNETDAEVVMVPSSLYSASASLVRKGEFDFISPSVKKYIYDKGLYRN